MSASLSMFHRSFWARRKAEVGDGGDVAFGSTPACAVVRTGRGRHVASRLPHVRADSRGRGLTRVAVSGLPEEMMAVSAIIVVVVEVEEIGARLLLAQTSFAVCSRGLGLEVPYFFPWVSFELDLSVAFAATYFA